MKKILILLLLCTFVAPIFADDALVLPKGVMRFYVVPTFSMADSEYDLDGEKVDMDSIKLMTVGAAVEYGVTDWISAAVQWTPGWGVWSDLEVSEYGYLTGPFDIFAGAKVQIIGPKAPVPNDTMRLCLAPGIKIPLPSPSDDSATEALNYFTDVVLDISTEEWLASNLDKHVLALGGRAYFDYLFTEDFFLNLYSELIYYLQDADATKGGATEGATGASDIGYGYDLTLEVEPSFWPWVAEGMQLKIGVPVTYVMSPEVEYDGTALADSDSYVLSVAPSVALFTTVLPMPIEVKASYSLPLMGKNAQATNTIILQIKGFLKF
jgi:hypothetical protein